MDYLVKINDQYACIQIPDILIYLSFQFTWHVALKLCFIVKYNLYLISHTTIVIVILAKKYLQMSHTPACIDDITVPFNKIMLRIHCFLN